MGLQAVSDILWQERQLLELLWFKLEEEQLVLAAGRSRWLSHATREAEMVLEQLRATELQRAIEVERVAKELQLGPEPSLTRLCEAVGEPWTHIFHDHRRAFLELANEIATVAQANRELLVRGQQATREALAWLGDGDLDVDVYSPTGTTDLLPVTHLLDQAL